MKLLISMLLLGLAGALGLQAGTITGTVRAEGKTPEEGSAGGKYASRKYKFVERVDYEELRDFVVFIDLKLTNTPAPPPKPLQVITQKDAVFRPHVMPVMAGTTVEWPNKDDIYHNVFSMSEAKPFGLGVKISHAALPAQVHAAEVPAAAVGGRRLKFHVLAETVLELRNGASLILHLLGETAVLLLQRAETPFQIAFPLHGKKSGLRPYAQRNRPQPEM